MSWWKFGRRPNRDRRESQGAAKAVGELGDPHAKGKMMTQMEASPSIVFAARKGDNKAVAALLKSGADVNAGFDGWTALMKAANYEFPETVRLLIEAGADVNLRDNKNCTALHRAAEHINLPIVKLLVEARADLNVQDINGHTALTHVVSYVTMWCKNEGNGIRSRPDKYKDAVEIVSMLLAAGANVHLKAFDLTPMAFVAREAPHAFPEIEELLKKAAG